MKRLLLSTLAILCFTASAWAKIMMAPPPATRAMNAQIVVVGKVAKIEKETLDVKLDPSDEKPTEFTVAIIKIEEGLVGATGLTHLKIAYRPGRVGRLPGTQLSEGTEAIFFLSPHSAEGGYYTFDYFSSPYDLKANGAKDELARVKRITTILEKPKESLAAKEAKDRTFAAAVLITHGNPRSHGEVKEEKLPLEESQALLKALAETDWSKLGEDSNTAMRAFQMLNLGKEDGWKSPVPKPKDNYVETLQAAFRDWLKGPGKEYQVKQHVPKK